jgi:hypothetical protein
LLEIPGLARNHVVPASVLRKTPCVDPTRTLPGPEAIPIAVVVGKRSAVSWLQLAAPLVLLKTPRDVVAYKFDAEFGSIATEVINGKRPVFIAVQVIALSTLLKTPAEAVDTYSVEGVAGSKAIAFTHGG